MKMGHKIVEARDDSSALAEVKLDALTRSSWTRRKRILACLVIFLFAFGVRFLSWQDTRGDVSKIQTVVVGDYKRIAKLLLAGGPASLFDSSSPLADPNNLGHPPGYSILLAVIYSVAGESDTATQVIQILADAFAAVLVFLIAAELLSAGVGLIAGLLVSLSPQFAWNSVLLLPDALAVLPLLLAVYLLTRAFRRPSLVLVLAAGVCVGLSCWLRANALLLAPFMALACLLIFEKGKRVRFGAGLLLGAVLVIAPLTIRNAIVFHHFIPLSLGAGQTFLEGIADYDPAGKLGVPATDMGIMKWEAENFNRPDYFGSLFQPDGVWRERMRLRRGLSIVSSHPVWFLGVMIKRATSMLRLERSRLVSAEPPVTHELESENGIEPVLAKAAAELKSSGSINPQTAVALLAPDNQVLELTGDDSKYGEQLVSAPIEVQKDTDYVLLIPVKILRGRMSLSLKSGSVIRASEIVETEEMKLPEEQPQRLIQLPFVSRQSGTVQLVISNAASQEVNPRMRIGALRLFNLGTASNTWTHIPRTLINLLQRLYITAVMLPLAILGLLLMVRRHAFRPLIILLVIPAYYLSIQSATHTEYRYVLALHYFLFSLAAFFIYTIGTLVRQQLRQVKLRQRFQQQ